MFCPAVLYTHIGSGGVPQVRVEEAGRSPFVILSFTMRTLLGIRKEKHSLCGRAGRPVPGRFSGRACQRCAAGHCCCAARVCAARRRCGACARACAACRCCACRCGACARACAACRCCACRCCACVACPAPPAVTAPQLAARAHCPAPMTVSTCVSQLGAEGSSQWGRTKYSGGSFVFDSAFGGALTEHLILYGEFLFHGISKPSGTPKR